MCSQPQQAANASSSVLPVGLLLVSIVNSNRYVLPTLSLPESSKSAFSPCFEEEGMVEVERIGTVV